MKNEQREQRHRLHSIHSCGPKAETSGEERHLVFEKHLIMQLKEVEDLKQFEKDKEKPEIRKNFRQVSLVLKLGEFIFFALMIAALRACRGKDVGRVKEP